MREVQFEYRVKFLPNIKFQEKVLMSAGKGRGNSLTSLLSTFRSSNNMGRGIGASPSISTSSFFRASIRGRGVLSATSSRTSITSRAEVASISHVSAPIASITHENLEINKHREEILEKINCNRVTIISAPTGTGKVSSHASIRYFSLQLTSNFFTRQPKFLSS